MHKTQQVIPKSPFTESKMHDLVEFNPWFLSEKVNRDPDNNIPFRLIWKTSDEGTTIHYVEDELVKFPYIVVTGKDVEKAVSKIRSQIEIYSPEELFKVFVDATRLFCV